LAGAGAGAAALGLAACGGSAGDDGATPESDESHKDFTMTVWGGETDKEAYQARIDLAAKKFPDYNIKLQLIPSENYAQKVQTMISSKTGPDIMQVAEDVNVYSSKSQLVALDDYISEAGLDLTETFGEGIGNLYKYEDKTYGIPDRSGAAILYFNKGLFEQKGIEAPSIDWTWDDFSSAAKELTDSSKGQFGFAGFGWWPNWFALIEQNGGHVIDPDSGKPTVNSAEAVEAMQWIQDLMIKDKVIPTDADYANMGPDMGGDGAFNLGKVAMNITGFWLIGGAAEADIDWDIAPVFHGANSAVSAFGSALTVPTAAKNPQGSFEIINFLTSAEGQAPIASRGQDVPANLEVQNSDTFLDPEWNTKDADINLQAFPDSADMIYTAPFIPEWNELQKACTDALANFWLGKSDAQASMDDLQSRLERVIK
jgi:multiple sugar transport system substrate-binding protein